MESKAELKPCPLKALGICAESQPVIGTAPGVIEREGQFYIKCQTCGCHTLWITGKAEAIAAWNQRPTDPIIEAAQKVADAVRAYDDYDGDDATEYALETAIVLNARELAALLPAKEPTA